MADIVFNRAKGAAHQLAKDNPNSWEVVLLESAESDGDLADHDDVDSMLGAGGNTEAGFTNYSRKTGITVTDTIDDGNDRVDLDMPDQTWEDAGNGSNESLAKAVVCVQTGADDSSLIPVVALDFTPTTDGSDITLEFDSDGFYRAKAA